MNKLLTKKQKQTEVTKQIKAQVKEIQKTLLRKAERAFNAGCIPETFMQKDNHLLCTTIIRSFCKDEPYTIADRQHRKDADNIHLFI